MVKTMREIIITENDAGRRVDRFLKIYFEKAPLSFIYKNLRKKNIKVNGKKASPEDILQNGDVIKLFLAEDTIKKFKKDMEKSKNSKFPDVLFENEDILLVNKPVNMLTHNDQRAYQDNALDRMVDYLIYKGEYNPRLENSFRPAFVNRLDRNTSGILIGAKNLKSLQYLNANIKNRNISKYYLTIVKGSIEKDFKVDINLKKSKDNVVSKNSSGKRSLTEFKVLKTKGGYTLLSVNLITGRTHQIRASLKEAGYFIIGDRKYGLKSENDKFRKLGLDSQYLHNFCVNFDLDEMKEISNRNFISMPNDKMTKIAEDLFDINLGEILNEKGVF
jgi:23S rRNA pseudouridine955/2504/2580 synthase